jgi:hypothetical protein
MAVPIADFVKPDRRSAVEVPANYNPIAGLTTDTVYTSLNNVTADLFHFSANSLPKSSKLFGLLK